MQHSAVFHKATLTAILHAVMSHPTLGPSLGFKGGTAAYLLYGLPRESVDLDFDLLQLASAEEVRTGMREVLRSFGSIKDDAVTLHGVYFLLSPKNKAPIGPNIKIDINARDFGSTYEVRSFEGIGMKVMVRPDMLAHKIVAMIERLGKANRDIFDTWFFLKEGWELNEDIVRLRAGKPPAEYLVSAAEKLERLRDYRILDGLGQFLNPKEKDWAKKNLVLDAARLLRQRAAALS